MSILENITALAKRRGFIYPGSELYGGLGGTWDYGPLGVELKNNIKQEFWRSMVQLRDDVVGLDTAIFMNPKVWEASGHVEAFTDPLTECKQCKRRFRADHIKDTCPVCGGELGEPKRFNLLVEAGLGAVEGAKQKVFLRGEITQGVHVNFKNVLDSSRVQIPFGIAQIGKAFRNEITPGQLTFRSREFEQMELQFYIKPDAKESKKWYGYWKVERMNWYLSLGFTKQHLRFRQHEKEERAHYARDAWDIEYDFSSGGDHEWKELEGVHHRGDWDLKRHEEYSGVDLHYTDPETGEKYLPWIIETSGGVDRAALFFLADAYTEENDRTVLKLHPKLAPYKVAVFPLLANKPELVKKAHDVYDSLKPRFMTAWDDRGNIGKRYRAQDEAGTPFTVTVDFDSLEHDDVTVRDRDSMEQERVGISELGSYLEQKLA